jgi:hypothetical protein
VNAKSTNKPSACVWRAGIFGILLATGLLVDEPRATAQSVISSQAPVTPLTTEWQQSQPDEMNVFLPSGQAPENPLPEMFQYGSVQLRPHVDYRFLYGSGVQSSPSNQQATVIQEISPGILINLGSHWTLNYTPTIRLYSNSQFQNGVDQAVSLVGATRYEDWTLGFSHSSSFTTAPTVQTGADTEQETHVTALTASCVLNSKMSADFALDQNITLVSGIQDSYDWSTMDWLNYEFWARLNAGLGAGGGYVLITGNSQTPGSGNQDMDQTYEQLQARVNWRATDKISFQISGGLEDRQFMTAGSSDSLSPVFGATIQYAPFKPTQISLSASRTMSSSDYYLAAQETEVTTVSVNLNQQLPKKFHLGLGVGYSQSDYDTSTGTTGANRTDDDVSFNISLSHPFFKRGTWSVFYQYNNNSSTQAGFGFESNQVGFEIGYAY